jgi:hypothetical protein
MIAHRAEHASIAQFFDKMEHQMRSMLHQHLSALDLVVDIDAATGFLRATVNGLVLSAVEHPDLWPAAAQKEAIELALRAILKPAAKPRARASARA